MFLQKLKKKIIFVTITYKKTYYKNKNNNGGIVLYFLNL